MKRAGSVHRVVVVKRWMQPRTHHARPRWAVRSTLFGLTALMLLAASAAQASAQPSVKRPAPKTVVIRDRESGSSRGTRVEPTGPSSLSTPSVPGAGVASGPAHGGRRRATRTATPSSRERQKYPPLALDTFGRLVPQEDLSVDNAAAAPASPPVSRSAVRTAQSPAGGTTAAPGPVPSVGNHKASHPIPSALAPPVGSSARWTLDRPRTGPAASTGAHTRRGSADPTPGTISGTVTDSTSGLPVSGVLVNAFGSGPTASSAVATATTSSSGTYTLSDVPPGTYYVDFEDHSGGHQLQWYDDEPSLGQADPVEVGAGITVPGVNASLVRGGSIAGTVTDASSHAALQGVCASVYTANDVFTNAGGCTNASGNFQTTGVPNGSYIVYFSDSNNIYLGQWSGGTASEFDASSVSVTVGAVTPNVDASMLRGGEITGTVTDSVTHDPISDICATTYSASDAFSEGCSNASGAYAITGLATGSYDVSFSDNSGVGYLAQDYASTVEVTKPSTTSGINAAMVLGGRITGTITDATTHDPVAGICVGAANGGGSSGTGCSNASGVYTISGLSTGSYDVSFSDSTGVGYLTQDYATAVHVAEPSTTSGINAAMVLGGGITGTITDATTHDPIANICAYSSVEGGTTADACSNASGVYSITGLATGSYSVAFYDSTDTGYLTQDYAAAVSVTQPSTISGINAAMVLGGAITGTITDATTHDPIAGLCAYVLSTGGGQVGQACSNSFGTYKVTGLTTGSYEVSFPAPYGSVYLSQYYDDQSTEATADTVAVTQSATASGINAAMNTGGEITGTVTDATTHTLIAGICVYAYSSDFDEDSCTNATGTYTLVGLPSGSYEVEFADESGAGYLTQYYNDQASSATANAVAVTQPSTTSGINAAMVMGGKITGTVTDATTHDPVAGTCVQAFTTSDDSHFGEGCSNSSGVYTIVGLATDSYDVYFAAPYQSNYLSQYYNDQPTETTATTVSVTQPATTPNINAALIVGGQITGTVTDAGTHDPLEGICVGAFSADETFSGESCTDAAGVYTIVGLHTGNYTVEFFDESGSGYLIQYYNDQSTYSTANAVSVTQATTTSGINAAMILGGDITGTVTDANSKAPIESANVCASVSAGLPVACASSDSVGNYTISGLASGSYVVSFEGPAESSYLEQWYNDQPTESTADPVTVTAPSTTVAINAQLEIAGSISGTITDAHSGLPIAGVCANAFSATDLYSPVASACSNSAGGYQIQGLTSGSYLVEFVAEAGDYIEQWYSNQPSGQAGNLIGVTTGVNTSDINAAMVEGGTISGTVIDATTHNPVANICAEFFDATSDAPADSAEYCTNSAGQYESAGLPAGSYTVDFITYGSPYLGQWYNDQSTQSAANSVSVTSNVDTGSINASLVEGGLISGTVTNATTHAPLADACVVDIFDGASEVAIACTDSAGNYTSTGLPAGSYTVEFDAGGYATQWYNDEATQGAANPVTVTLGATTSGINAALALGGTISGTVVDGTSHAPLADICVEVVSIFGFVTPCDESSSDTTRTNASGDYTLNLPAGTYTVAFYDETGSYLTQYYNDQSAPSSANEVTVTAGANTPNIDAAMTVGATISGTITDASSDVPLSNVCIGVFDHATQSPLSFYDRCSNSAGAYTSQGLPAGTYDLRIHQS